MYVYMCTAESLVMHGKFAIIHCVSFHHNANAIMLT